MTLPTRRKSGAAVLIVELIDDNLVATLTGTERGLAGYNSEDAESIRRKPSSGPYETFQLTGYKSGRATITCDDNPVTHPVFTNKTGRRFRVTYRELGTVGGGPQEIFSGPAQVGLNVERGGARTFAITFTSDGAINAAPQLDEPEPVSVEPEPDSSA